MFCLLIENLNWWLEVGKIVMGVEECARSLHQHVSSRILENARIKVTVTKDE